MLRSKLYITLNITLFLGLLLLFNTSMSSKFEGGLEFCEYYARDMIHSPYKKNKCLLSKEPNWSNEKNTYIKECQTLSIVEANSKRAKHILNVRSCNDDYKSILLGNTNIVAPPASNVDEVTKFEKIREPLKQSLITALIKSPYLLVYPHININEVKKCDLISLPIDIDNIQQTQDWVIATKNNCLTNQEHSHVWILQKTATTDRILLEGEAGGLGIRISTHNAYKNIQMIAYFSPIEKTSTLCGGVYAEWQYVGNRYIPYKATPILEGDCFPEYRYSESEQIRPPFLDSPSSEIKAYEDISRREEREKSALLAPYVKNISNYIPNWLKKMERLTKTTIKNSQTRNFDINEKKAIERLLNVK